MGLLWQLARARAAVLRRGAGLKRHWYRLMFALDAMGTLRSFSCGNGVWLDVPVWVGNGQGSLEISDRVGLGCANAPGSGSGRILLEPRAPGALIVIGAETILSNNVAVVAMNCVRFGTRCRIGDAVQVFDCDFHEIDPARRDASTGRIEPVIIGNNVWLGSRVTVLRGVTIGNNSVVGAGSVVTKSIPANSLAAGVPAKVIRTL
jgi:acetyltransferase-like isoleucine patch superfamily enzyme